MLALLGFAACAATAATGGDSAPSVTILTGPPSRTSARHAHFRFAVAPARARTWCKLDRRPYRRCRAGARYASLRARRHTFTVRAKDGWRVRSVRRSWTVVRPPQPASTVAQLPAPVPPPVDPGVAPPNGGNPPEPGGGPAPLFSDDFNGTSINRAAWELYDGPGNAGNGLRRPSALALDGVGNLVVTATTQNGTLVSGGMSHRVDYAYGRFVFRVRTEADPTATLNAVVLTWPERQWSPEYSENDMYETGWHPNNTSQFSTYIHFGMHNWQQWFTHDSDPTQWHTIEMDWRPDRLAIYRDGAFAWETTDRAAIPDVAHHLCIQLDAITNRMLARPVRMFVDWVRIYA